MKHQLFSKPVLNHIQNEYIKIIPINTLFTVMGKCVIFGLLYKNSENQYSCEDIYGKVTLDLSESSFSDGFYLEGCFVLLEGMIDNNVFKVTVNTLLKF